MDKEFSNIRIVDIAKMAGVSVGTVDRVIHNRGRVSEENRKKCRLFWRWLITSLISWHVHWRLRNSITFIAITPSFCSGEYWEAISEGIDKAASEMGSYNITITKLFLTSMTTKLLMI